MALSENATLEEIVNEIDRLNKLIVNRGGAQTITPKTTNQVLSKGNYKGNITIKGDANLISSNILKGKSIFGVSGTLSPGLVYSSSYDSTTNPEMTGTQWLSHTITSSFGFVPTRVIVWFQYLVVDGSSRFSRISLDSKYNNSTSNYLQTTIGHYNSMRILLYISNIGSNGFKINWQAPYSSYTGRLSNIHWIAFKY